MKDAKQKAESVADRAESKWAKLKADAAAKMDDMKAKADRRADQMDAEAAVAEADWAEADAVDAISYAEWTIDNARLAALDAIDARIQADELAAKASS
jgi:glycerol-3-phosphate dehydrogenase